MKHLVILAALAGGLLWLTAGKIVTAPYGYDEADYMVDASFGYFANWMDAGTLPILDFLKAGLNRGRDAGQQVALSQMVRESRDPVVYRHWHGPLYYYWLVTIAPWHLNEGEARRLSLLFPILTAIVLYLGTLRILPRPAAQPAAILTCALFLWGQVTAKTTELAPHMLFVLCYLLALLFLARMMGGGGRVHWYAAVACTGLAFCTLEVTIALLVTLAVCGYLHRQELGMNWTLALQSLALLAVTILVVWPGAFLKLSFVKAYLTMAYLAVFRKAPWGDIGFAGTWALRFASSPVEWLAIAASLAVFCKTRLWRTLPQLIPFAIYSPLMLVLVLRVNTEILRYILPFFPALLVMAGWTGGWMLSRNQAPGREWLRYGAVAAAAVLLLAITHTQLRNYLLRDDPYPRAMLAAIQERGLQAKTVLAPQVYVPILHYYFPQAIFHGYLETREIPGLLATNSHDGVLYPDYPVRLDVAPQPGR